MIYRLEKLEIAGRQLGSALAELGLCKNIRIELAADEFDVLLKTLEIPKTTNPGVLRLWCVLGSITIAPEKDPYAPPDPSSPISRYRRKPSPTRAPSLIAKKKLLPKKED